MISFPATSYKFLYLLNGALYKVYSYAGGYAAQTSTTIYQIWTLQKNFKCFIEFKLFSTLSLHFIVLSWNVTK